MSISPSIAAPLPFELLSLLTIELQCSSSHQNVLGCFVSLVQLHALFPFFRPFSTDLFLSLFSRVLSILPLGPSGSALFPLQKVQNISASTKNVSVSMPSFSHPGTFPMSSLSLSLLAFYHSLSSHLQEIREEESREHELRIVE